MAQTLSINGTGIFVDERGPADGPAVLFIHGGPGNPSWDFMESVGDLFAAQGYASSESTSAASCAPTLCPRYPR
ncbi:hypothetical protein L2X99_07480 [Microbacterium sp. KUDC0406]|uniref:alpha/beta fold hydrolase n=1 Tax=Microbacterium sp. KUDC0406 TaxID=2909588 RepID=UPI001F2F8204|nr:hypothetical protein [Microbacterium sp. KUDC0406]UJP11350.1 hypothetical protein L2X99_07480 [Microbacterium sp. KUDC0406]